MTQLLMQAKMPAQTLAQKLLAKSAGRPHVAVGEILDDTVWLPLNSPGCHVYAELGVREGDQVGLTRGGGA